MSDPSETGGRPLASTQQQPEGTIQQLQPSLARTKRRKTSQSSDERVGGTKSTQARRRPGTRKEASSFGPQPHTGSSRGDSSTMQRSTSPRNLSPEVPTVNYTRTGRISKAKKGLKVHHCECGRSYTRAEHLRRHQKNHAQDDALVCEIPGCGKTFYRLDLLQRHQERHNEMGKDSRQQSVFSSSGAAEQEVVSTTATLPPNVVTTQSPYYTSPPVPAQNPEARYTSNPFRTPQIPSSAFGHVLRSSPHSKSSPNHPTKRGVFHSHQTTRGTTALVPVDGLNTNISWTDPFSQSPNYSSSSGYASPIPGTGDYTMFTNPPYGPGSNRTRTSSNASFIEPWGYPSRSPTSATSTMAYTWTSNDKSPAPSSLAYMATSYPMTSVPMAAGVDPMSSYGHFGPKTMAQRDEEEQAFLFPEQSYGMGQIAHTYPFEQYLDNYWRLFHPAFPVVHRTTFDGMNESPMLHAAMIAVGGQYSNDASVKRKSRILHDRCMKLLDQRDLNVMTEAERLCDYQALFLVEVLSQYRARRAAKTLSARFESLYQKLCGNFQIIASNNINLISAVQVQPENATYKQWSDWISDSVHQRLLLCCYILEYQQTTLLGRNPQQSLIQYSGFDLPFPAHSALWDATNPSEWAVAAQQYAHLPTYVYEVAPHMSSGPFDAFQSSLLIAAHYNHFNNPTPYLALPTSPAIDHLLDATPITKHNLLTAKLLQATPIRALLAVSGESWILSEKVPSPQAFSSYKTTLRTWVGGLWAAPTGEQNQPVKYALKHSIEILQQAMMAPTHSLRLELGADMGLYFAALVVWAVTVAANSRINAPNTQTQQQRYQSHSPLPSSSTHTSSGHYPSTPTSTHFSLPSSISNTSPNPAHPTNIGLSNPRSSPATTSTNNTNSNAMLSHSEITLTSISFLSSALLELDLLGFVQQWPKDVHQWQQGCAALMRWVKMRLRNGPGPDGLEARDSVVGLGMSGVGTSTNLGVNGSGRGGDGLGELLDGVIGTLEKIMGRGWEGWGV